MTDPEMEGIGAQALNMAKRDLERDQFTFLFATYFAMEIPPLRRMTKVEAMLIERLGEAWLESGPRKDVAFGVLRTCVDAIRPDAVMNTRRGRNRAICMGCGKPMRVPRGWKGWENIRCPKCREEKRVS